jgi:hypothetical protein
MQYCHITASCVEQFPDEAQSQTPQNEILGVFLKFPSSSQDALIQRHAELGTVQYSEPLLCSLARLTRLCWEIMGFATGRQVGAL